MRRLVIRPGAIGDCIVSLPALEFLRTDYLEVWTSSAIVPLVRLASHVRSIASTGLDLAGVTEAPAWFVHVVAPYDLDDAHPPRTVTSRVMR